MYYGYNQPYVPVVPVAYGGGNCGGALCVIVLIFFILFVACGCGMGGRFDYGCGC